MHRDFVNRWLKVFLVGILAVIALSALSCRRTRDNAPKFETPYQAVLLDNGQVFYGKMQGAGTAYPVLTDVFYIQTKVDPQTKAVTNVLIRRGNEWHAPDRMYLNARHIVLIEPVGQNSKVAQLISEAKK
ncbi:MAG: hypothetical protein ACRD3T_07865 [Terriglobia bacterium]